MSHPTGFSSLEEIEASLSTVNGALQQATGNAAKSHLMKIRDGLTGMLVARQEIANADALHGRGELTSDQYLTQRKKLLRDFYACRNEISEVEAPRLIDDAPEPVRSRLRIGWEKAKAEGSFLIPLAALVLDVVKALTAHP